MTARKPRGRPIGSGKPPGTARRHGPRLQVSPEEMERIRAVALDGEGAVDTVVRAVDALAETER